MTKGFSSAPAWRIVLSYFALFFAVHRGAMGFVLAHDGAVGLAAFHWVQVASAIFLFVALRWSAQLIVPALLLTGGLLGGSALLAWGLGWLSPTAAAMQLGAAVVGTGVFAALVRMGIKDDERKQREQHS